MTDPSPPAAASSPQTVAITGASGFIGRALVARLQARGDSAVAVRRATSGESAGPRWDPERGFTPPDALSGFDAIVHLAGEGVAEQRWSSAQKQRILDSRVLGTRAVVDALRAAQPRPRALICASAVGLYGDRGDEVLTEAASPGGDFLAEVTRAWEHEANAAAELPGVRVVTLRFGVVLGRGGGALQKMLTPFKLGVGGPVASGRQYMSWVHLDDAVGAIVFALDRPDARGPFNVTAPEPVTNAAFTAALARALHRPAFMPVPAAALSLLYGEMGRTVMVQGQRVVPARLLEAGYTFARPDLADAMADAVTPA